MFLQVVAKPKAADALDEKYLDLLMKIVEAGKDSDRKKDNDKKKIWLYLLCQDVYLTTKQVHLVVSLDFNFTVLCIFLAFKYTSP